MDVTGTQSVRQHQRFMSSGDSDRVVGYQSFKEARDHVLSDYADMLVAEMKRIAGR